MSRGVILLRAGVAAFVGIMLAGPGATIFPSTLRWAAWIACPSGTTPTPRTFSSSYRAPGESSVERGVAFYCVAADGTEHERTLAAVGGLALMYFMGIMVLLSLLAARRASRAGVPNRPRLLGAGRGAAGANAAVPRRAPTADVGVDVEARARELLAQEQKIHAIKVVRDATGMGLKEAKEWVEALPHRAPSTAPPPSSGTAGTTGIGAVDRLAELKRMFDAGLITAGEFEAKKAEILAGL